MSKNWLSVITALGLVTASGAAFVARRSALGPEVKGPPGWDVRVLVEGTLLTKDASIAVVRPLDFRRQHIAGERFQSDEGLREPVKWRRFNQQKNTWRRQADRDAPAPFHLEYAFVCSWQRPMPAMERLTEKLDAPPLGKAYLQSTPTIQAKNERIVQAARSNAGQELSASAQAQALATFVRTLQQSAPDAQTALACLVRAGGDALAKARLLVALCRSRGIPGRVVGGLLLSGRGPQQPHFWSEAWDGTRWLPLDPTRAGAGPDQVPENYLVIRITDGSLVSSRGARIQYSFAVKPRQASSDTAAEGNVAYSAAKNFWRKVSLYSLHVSEQHLVEFLVMLPLAALVVSIARTLVGITTFGIFAPALIGLAFLDLKALPFGLMMLLLTVLAGWGLRRGLEHFHLLQVPRVSAMLSLIVLFLLVMIVAASNLGITTTRYISLFPLVILTFLVERFWTIEEEDSTAASFKILLGTIGVAVLVSLALGQPGVRIWMIRYPETLGVVLACQFLLGRYTGYRLTELYRFGDLIKEEPSREEQA